MKLSMIPIVTGAFGTVTKVMVQGLEDFEIRARVDGLVSLFNGISTFVGYLMPKAILLEE